MPRRKHGPTPKTDAEKFDDAEDRRLDDEAEEREDARLASETPAAAPEPNDEEPLDPEPAPLPPEEFSPVLELEPDPEPTPAAKPPKPEWPKTTPDGVIVHWGPAGPPKP